MEDICRVCRAGRLPDRPLFHPCRCTGSIKYVHQDCLMQWLRHSGKEFCEVCNHKFQFASVYRHDMPNWIPLKDIYQIFMRSVVSKLGRWFHFGFVIFMWLFFVPIITYRIFKCMIYTSIWSLLLLPVKVFTIENMLLDSLFGVVIVVLSILGFISLVWLKDQLSTGDCPQWLVSDRDSAKIQKEDELRRKADARDEAHRNIDDFIKSHDNQTSRQSLSEELKQLDQAIEPKLLSAEVECLKWQYNELSSLRIKAMTLEYDLGMSLIQYQPLLSAARRKQLKGIESWRAKIFDTLSSEGRIPPGVRGLPAPFANALKETPLPSLEQLGLNSEEIAVIELFSRLPKLPSSDLEKRQLISQLQSVKTELKECSVKYLNHQQQLTEMLNSRGLLKESSPIMEQLHNDIVTISEKRNDEIEMMTRINHDVRVKFPEAFERGDLWYGRLTGQQQNAGEQNDDNVPMGQQERQDNDQQQDLVQEQVQQQPDPVQMMRRPNIGEALVGLAREPQDPNAEAMQADQLMRMIGLDGSFRFLEHIVWLIVLVSLIIMAFVYIPACIGLSLAWMISLWEKIGIENWKTMCSVLLGYCVILVGVVLAYYMASIGKVLRIKPFLGVVYLALKVCLLLFLEAGVFPLLCGWWIDVCAFSLLGSTLKSREESLNSAPGTVMFLHWLAGMIFVFYFASLIVLLREVWRPGVLWFLRNLDDQNFHPVQDMMLQPLQRQMRRFLMSNIMFGISIMLIILLPSHIIFFILPNFLPFNLTLISLVSPVREIQLELILLQFVIPTLLEHSNLRKVLKKLIISWSNLTARFLGLQSYLLDRPQSGGHVFDIHGNPIQYIEPDSTVEGPVYIGEAQTLGPGYAPFKPYLRPKYFGIKISMFIILLASSILLLSTFSLTLPILIGRCIMFLVGISTPPDVYTASIGIYVIWIVGRVLSSLVSGISKGLLSALLQDVVFWIRQGMKCAIACVFLFVVIPLLLGHLVNLLLISPIRVPLYKTPLFYYTTEWALGLLHMKCTCGVIWLTDTSFKRTLDTLYQNGAKNLNLMFVIKEIVAPVVCNLILCLAVPYVFFLGIVRMTGLFSSATCFTLYRYCYPAILLLLVIIVVVLIVVKQSHNLYTSIRNEKYLIGRQIMNFGKAPSYEISSLSSPVEETREDH